MGNYRKHCLPYLPQLLGIHIDFDRNEVGRPTIQIPAYVKIPSYNPELRFGGRRHLVVVWHQRGYGRKSSDAGRQRVPIVQSL